MAIEIIGHWSAFQSEKTGSTPVGSAKIPTVRDGLYLFFCLFHAHTGSHPKLHERHLWHEATSEMLRNRTYDLLHD